MMCLLSGSEGVCEGPGLVVSVSGERGHPLLDSDISDGEGVFGGVSMEGMGWSLKQADS